MAPSDNRSFYVAGVPSLFVHTGMHAQYHTPEDDWEQIDATGCEAVTRFVFRLAWYLAESPIRPRYRSSEGVDFFDVLRMHPGEEN